MMPHTLQVDDFLKTKTHQLFLDYRQQNFLDLFAGNFNEYFFIFCATSSFRTRIDPTFSFAHGIYIKLNNIIISDNRKLPERSSDKAFKANGRFQLIEPMGSLKIEDRLASITCQLLVKLIMFFYYIFCRKRKGLRRSVEMR